MSSTGSQARPALARRAVDLGCYFSVNATMLAHDRGRALVQNIPSQRLLTETDAPLTEGEPPKVGSMGCARFSQEIATMTNLSVQETKVLIAANGRHVFRFAGVELPV